MAGYEDNEGSSSEMHTCWLLDGELVGRWLHAHEPGLHFEPPWELGWMGLASVVR